MYQDIRLRTRRFALRAINLVETFVRNREAYIIGRQLIRSATSVGANLAEASAARTKVEFGSINGIALKEGKETIYWLQLASEANLTDYRQIKLMISEAEEISKIIATIIINSQKVK